MLFVITNLSIILTFVFIEKIGLTLLIYSHFLIIILYALSVSRLLKIFMPNMILFMAFALVTTKWQILAEGFILYALTCFLLYNHVVIIRQLRRQVILCQRNINEGGLKDSLSGLYNNAYIYEYLNNRIKHINDGNLSVLMMDIDNFKKINDQHGHLYGDQIIKKIALLLNESTGDDDVLGRYGGEEFIAILNNADFERSIKVAEEIRTKIENLKIDNETKVTISIGIAFYNNDTAENLIKKADDQLFHAKKLGKNRVKGEKEAL
ncbi:MAG: GGDEF domain-containing protein [Clostridiales bacterium]|nr:GGDEF domain-containing protein [Clostridiales bacterium]